VEILVPLQNKAASGGAKNPGARFEGVLRNKLILGGKSQDGAMFSLVSEDLHLFDTEATGRREIMGEILHYIFPRLRYS